MRVNYIILGILMLLLTACENMALMSTPKKQAQASNTPLSQHAEMNFWDTLHEGRYDRIEETDRLLTAAYLQNPDDPQLAAHLGFLHIWKITERGREKTIQPMIVNEIVLSKKYFHDAVELNPNEARYLGFYGDTELVEGKIFDDAREQTRGYFTLLRAIDKWPQFNYFTAGYPMSTLPSSSKRYKEALEWQWQTLALCAGHPINRDNPDFSPYMKLETQHGVQRVCWNSWIAPYNFEGFFMNMGDMLVKAGDWQTAIKIYRNAQLEKNYSHWPYRSMLEKRILEAQDNVVNFQKAHVGRPEKAMMFDSGYGCVACHQQNS